MIISKLIGMKKIEGENFCRLTECVARAHDHFRALSDLDSNHSNNLRKYRFPSGCFATGVWSKMRGKTRRIKRGCVELLGQEEEKLQSVSRSWEGASLP